MNLLLEIQSLRVKLFTYEEGPDQVFFFFFGWGTWWEKVAVLCLVSRRGNLHAPLTSEKKGELLPVSNTCSPSPGRSQTPLWPPPWCTFPPHTPSPSVLASSPRKLDSLSCVCSETGSPLEETMKLEPRDRNTH